MSMRLEGIPTAYLRPPHDDCIIVHVREGPTISSIGSIWRRRLREREYALCQVSEIGESVEGVLLSPGGKYVHCKISRRKGFFLLESAIVTFSVSEGKTVSRITDSALLPLRDSFTRATIYSLVQGSARDELVECVAMFGQEDGFEESWLVKVDVLTERVTLESQLPFSFW